MDPDNISAISTASRRAESKSGLSGVNGEVLTACATMEKNPFKILAARYDSKDVAAAHQADVASATEVKRTRTGNRPK